MKNLKETLMQRDGVSAEEADELILAAQQDLQDYLAEDDMDSAYDICAEHFGLEPDYLIELFYRR